MLGLRVPPVRADPVGPVEVRWPHNVQEGARLLDGA